MLAVTGMTNLRLELDRSHRDRVVVPLYRERIRHIMHPCIICGIIVAVADVLKRGPVTDVNAHQGNGRIKSSDAVWQLKLLEDDTKPYACAEV